jgi:hypothetical protein
MHNKGQAEKRTTQDGRVEGCNKEGPSNQGWVHQDRTKYTTAVMYKAVADMPLNTHHRYAVCNYCLHGNCGIEPQEMEKNKVPFSHKAISFACIGRIRVGQLIKMDKVFASN